MKYKVGDRVRVRQWEDMEKEFGLDEDGDIRTKACFTRQMGGYCGKEAEIERITSTGNYFLTGIVGIEGWSFSPDTLESSEPDFPVNIKMLMAKAEKGFFGELTAEELAKINVNLAAEKISSEEYTITITVKKDVDYEH